MMPNKKKMFFASSPESLHVCAPAVAQFQACTLPHMPCLPLLGFACLQIFVAGLIWHCLSQDIFSEILVGMLLILKNWKNWVSLGGIPIVTWICWVHRSFQPCSAVALDFD